MCGFSVNLECRSETCCARLAENTARKKIANKAPSGHHPTNLSGYIFANMFESTIGKNLLSSKISCTCPHNIVNFGLLAPEIRWRVWAPLHISTGFASWQRYCTALSSSRQPNFAALNRGRHQYSAGRPSRWALAHISSLLSFIYLSSFFPRLISAVADWMSTILPHMVWP